MERLPEWAKAIIGMLGILFLPTVGYIYSQGQGNQVKEQLVAANSELVVAIRVLTNQMASLNEKLSAEMVKINYNEQRINKLEDKVLYNSHKFATMKDKDDNDG